MLILLLAALPCCRRAETVNGGSDSAAAVVDTIAAAPEAEEAPAEPDSLVFGSAARALEYMRLSPDSAKYSAGIIPGIARTSVDYATRLLNNRFPYFIVVDKQKMKVVLFDKFGRSVLDYGIACSRYYGTKHKRRDNRTPEGFFTVEGVYDSTEWLYTDDDGVTHPGKGVYGQRFIRLDVPNTRSIGIHGTNAPGSIGGRRSHGCVRVQNDNIMELARYASKGMPVIVSPSDRDMAVNKEEGCFIPQIETGVEPYGRKETAAPAKTEQPDSVETAPAAEAVPEPEAPEQHEPLPAPEIPQPDAE